MLQDGAYRGWWRLIRLLIQYDTSCVVGSKRRLTEAAARDYGCEHWQVRCSQTRGSPPIHRQDIRYHPGEPGMLRVTCAGWRLDHDDPGHQQSAQSLGRCLGNCISIRPLSWSTRYVSCSTAQVASPQLIVPITVRGYASPTCGQLLMPPVSPLSACCPEILIRVLFCTCHEGSRDRGAQVCAT